MENRPNYLRHRPLTPSQVNWTRTCFENIFIDGFISTMHWIKTAVFGFLTLRGAQHVLQVLLVGLWNIFFKILLLTLNKEFGGGGGVVFQLKHIVHVADPKLWSHPSICWSFVAKNISKLILKITMIAAKMKSVVAIAINWWFLRSTTAYTMKKMLKVSYDHDCAICTLYMETTYTVYTCATNILLNRAVIIEHWIYTENKILSNTCYCLQLLIGCRGCFSNL